MGNYEVTSDYIFSLFLYNILANSLNLRKREDLNNSLLLQFFWMYWVCRFWSYSSVVEWFPLSFLIYAKCLRLFWADSLLIFKISTQSSRQFPHNFANIHQFISNVSISRCFGKNTYKGVFLTPSDVGLKLRLTKQPVMANI